MSNTIGTFRTHPRNSYQSRWTRRRTCRHCGKEIFVHCYQRDAYSDPAYVLFDDLGWPWPKHTCVEYFIHRIQQEPDPQIQQQILRRLAGLAIQ